ncbi:MAG TPA: alpha/beta hydrolase [Streptosporangiaceae bacterium]|nr:alpha/beta hydrolase [Streptosporangiaceae bacterium]
MTGLPRRCWVVALAVLTATTMLTAGCGGNSTATALRDRLLAVTDLPAGWSAVPVNPDSVQTSAPCLSSLAANPEGWTYQVAAFVQGTAIPTLSEVLVTGPQLRQRWESVAQALSRCRTATLTINGTKVNATVRPLPFPRVTSTSSAYAWGFTISGIQIGFDLILFETGTYAGYLAYSDLGPPAAATVRAFADAAVAKAETGATARIPDGVSVASAPVRTAHTALGTVAYRTVGSGPPLVMITGYGGTMEGWDRRFVDALARHYRVVIFDNAGVGPTQALPAPLSIDAMANQTSALIAALGLSRPDILGWSMGSMIAQALAVLHPGQVRRLVLCASYPGNGTAIRPSEAAIHALTSGSPQQALADLFPAGQGAAQNTYLAAISSYPAAPGAPASTVAAQGHAIDQWWAGQDPAGEQAGEITAPALIADGTADRLDPLANSHALVGLIPGAKLTLYPDAGHAFLFQDQAAFILLIESFLG